MLKRSEELVNAFRAHQSVFFPVVAFDPHKDRLVQLDFTAANQRLAAAIAAGATAFSGYIDSCITAAQARYGIGGYAEHRTVYAMSKVFDSQNPGGEPRRLHLGTDIWGPSGTAVMAPMDGTVHSFAANNLFGDYGSTIILTHCLEGITFHTLYGHLSYSSIEKLKTGDPVAKGESFATFGIPAENGGWPPHLHFQLILDMEGRAGDYPGVCAYSEKDQWLANSPDPDFILQLNQHLQEKSGRPGR